ncbi:hypothetical protein [Flavobacterium okayamense]|uniref:Uncharacterized protein n=1 Tax=Flavobacterium okayamense TaxID=2830782 RepID=A0ABM7S6X1_9FLAO|nr:hypothetical protein [Flavobacterium okayamense]BCY28469.1 hypothetical protein KK2020170_13370 [Flavobacterium okayamense]
MIKKNEVFWFIVTLILIFILNLFIFGINGVNGDTSIDLKNHETFFTIKNYYIILLNSSILFYSIYLIRVIISKFNNNQTNVIFIITSIFLILTITIFNSIYDSFLGQFNGWTIYPPLSALEPENGSFIDESENIFFPKLFLVSQVILSSLIAYTGVKIGVNLKTD